MSDELKSASSVKTGKKFSEKRRCEIKFKIIMSITRSSGGSH